MQESLRPPRAGASLGLGREVDPGDGDLAERVAPGSASGRRPSGWSRSVQPCRSERLLLGECDRERRAGICEARSRRRHCNSQARPGATTRTVAPNRERARSDLRDRRSGDRTPPRGRRRGARRVPESVGRSRKRSSAQSWRNALLAERRAQASASHTPAIPMQRERHATAADSRPSGSRHGDRHSARGGNRSRPSGSGSGRVFPRECDRAASQRPVIACRRERSPRGPRRGDRIRDGAIIRRWRLAPPPGRLQNSDRRRRRAGADVSSERWVLADESTGASDRAACSPCNPAPCDTATPALLVADSGADATACRNQALHGQHVASRSHLVAWLVGRHRRARAGSRGSARCPVA
jgi:hypothetical protein